MTTHVMWRRATCVALAVSAGLAACASAPDNDEEASIEAAVTIDPDDDVNEPVIEAAACTPPTLALDAESTRFTIDGQQTFLQCVSYFGALALSDASMTADFSDLKARGFNCVRVWPSWGYAGISPSSYDQKAVIKPGGVVDSTNLQRLKRLIEIAAQHYFIVDVTLTRDNVRQRGCISYAQYRSAVLQVTSALKPYRNTFFDLQNETDHYASASACDSTAIFPFCPTDPDEPANPVDRTCNIAYLSPARWTDLSGAVRAADTNRVITISGADASFQPRPDAAMVHCCRGTGWPGGLDEAIDGAEATFPNRPVHAQEPNRCRRFSSDGNSLVDCAAARELDPATNTFLAAAGFAASAGADGFTLHTGASYDLTSQRLNPRLNQAELVARNNLGSRVPPRGARPAAPVLIAPLDGAVVGTRPVLRWEPGAAYPPINQYKVLIKRRLPDGTFQNVDSAFTCATQYGVPAGVLTVGQTYRWVIKAQNDLGWGPTARRQFTVQ